MQPEEIIKTSEEIGLEFIHLVISDEKFDGDVSSEKLLQLFELLATEEPLDPQSLIMEWLKNAL